MICDVQDAGTIELYFYGELPPAERLRVQAHIVTCPDCRHALDDLETIRAALTSRPDVAAPPAGDWSGFMTRLETAVSAERGVQRREQPPRLLPVRFKRQMYWYAAAAAILTLVTMRVLTVPRAEPARGARTPTTHDAVVPASAPSPPRDAAFATLSGQHFERSKLVLLGLATRDPQADAGDWKYERDLASTLLDDTRLYRMAAEERGMTSLAGVMRDLELVLLQTSMTEDTNTESLEQLQRLIRRRDLLTKMNTVYGGS